MSSRSARRALVLALCLAGCGARTNVGAGSVDAGADAARDAGADAPAMLDGSACEGELVARDRAGAAALLADDDAVLWSTPDGHLFAKDATGTRELAAQAASSMVRVGANVYYTVTGELRAVPFAGGAPRTVAGRLGQPFDLHWDGEAFYLLDRGAGIASGRVLRVEPGGATTEVLGGLGTPSGLSMDDDFLYVAADFALFGNGTQGPLLRVSKTGGPAVLLASNLRSPRAVRASGDRLYVLETVDAQFTQNGGLRWIAKAPGDTLHVVANTPGVMPLDFTIDGADAWVTTFSGSSGQNRGALLRMATDGSRVTEVTATPAVLYLAVRATESSVYWTIGWTQGNTPSDPVSVRKLCK